LYARADLLAPALAQFDLWISNHPDDSKRANALNGRCRVRALQGQELPKALSDCTAALRLSPNSSPAAASILTGRALVRLRMGDYDKSIADYDESLKLASGNAWALYGRGIAKTRKNKLAEGEADRAAAVKLSPHIGDEFTRRGITP
jgi:tetratricopeptide (TPR) repeat protein